MNNNYTKSKPTKPNTRHQTNKFANVSARTLNTEVSAVFDKDMPDSINLVAVRQHKIIIAIYDIDNRKHIVEINCPLLYPQQKKGFACHEIIQSNIPPLTFVRKINDQLTNRILTVRSVLTHFTEQYNRYRDPSRVNNMGNRGPTTKTPIKVAKKIEPKEKPVNSKVVYVNTISNDGEWDVPDDQSIDQMALINKILQSDDKPVVDTGNRSVDEPVNVPVNAPLNKFVNVPVNMPIDVPISEFVDVTDDIPVIKPVNKSVVETVKESVMGSIEKPETESVKEPIDESVKEPMTESVKEPMTESVREPIDESVKEPMTESVKEPMTESVKESMTESVKEPMTESVKESMTESVKESMAESVKEPMTESVKEPAIEPVNEPMIVAVKESIVEPVNEPLTEPILESTVEPMMELVTEPIIEPDSNLIEESISQAVKEPMTESIESVTELVIEHVDESIEHPLQLPVTRPPLQEYIIEDSFDEPFDIPIQSSSQDLLPADPESKYISSDEDDRPLHEEPVELEPEAFIRKNEPTELVDKNFDRFVSTFRKQYPQLDDEVLMTLIQEEWAKCNTTKTESQFVSKPNRIDNGLIADTTKTVSTVSRTESKTKLQQNQLHAKPQKNQPKTKTKTKPNTLAKKTEHSDWIKFDDVRDDLGLYLDFTQFVTQRKRFHGAVDNLIDLAKKIYDSLVVQPSTTSKRLFSRENVIRRIINELDRLQPSVQCINDNIFQLMMHIPIATPINVIIQLDPVSYPMVGPYVRLVSPKLTDAIYHQIANLPCITNWSPTCSLSTISLEIENLVSGQKAEPSDGDEVYDDLERYLFDLALLINAESKADATTKSDIKPRKRLTKNPSRTKTKNLLVPVIAKWSFHLEYRRISQYRNTNKHQDSGLHPTNSQTISQNYHQKHPCRCYQYLGEILLHTLCQNSLLWVYYLGPLKK